MSDRRPFLLARRRLAARVFVLALPVAIGGGPALGADDFFPTLTIEREAERREAKAKERAEALGDDPSALEDPSLLQRYDDLLTRRIEQVMSKNQLWRNTAVPLQGMFLLQYKYTSVRASKRFDGQGKEGPPLKPIDVFGGKLDFGLRGEGEGHTIQLLYGITDRVALFMEQPFGRLTPEFNIRYDPPSFEDPFSTAPLLDSVLPVLFPEGFRDSLSTLEGLWQAIELFGRPRPNTEQISDDLELGDFVFGLGVDYYRSDWLGLVAALKVTTPTGHIADANNALTYALGPELDIGVGHWGLSLQQWIDWRIPAPVLEDFSWTLEFGWTYYFEDERDSPDFAPPTDFALASGDNFLLATLLRALLPPERSSGNAVDFTVQGNLIDVIQAVDPALAEELAPVFPDLSGLDSTFDYRPGQQLAGQLQVGHALFGLVPVSVGTIYQWTEASEIKSNVEEFKLFVDAVELVADSWLWSAWAKVSLPLIPLKLPMNVSFGMQWAIAGENAFIFEDNMEFTATVVSPWFFPEW